MSNIFKTTESGEAILPTVSKETFREFVRIQVSGLTNMMDGTTVCKLSGKRITKEDHIYIIKNYSDLSRFYEITTDNF